MFFSSLIYQVMIYFFQIKRKKSIWVRNALGGMHVCASMCIRVGVRTGKTYNKTKQNECSHLNRLTIE